MGKCLKLSNGRRLVDDVIYFANQFPTAGIMGEFDVSQVAEIRRKTSPKISWNVIMMKAFAIVAEEMPELKQCYVSFPWAYLYQYDYNIAMMTIVRKHEGEDRLFFSRFNRPDATGLLDLQKQYDTYRKAPIDEIKQFRHQIQFAKLPRFIRRSIWWAVYNLWPQKRAAHFGTFGMSVSGYKGCYGTVHLSPTTTTLGVDPVPRKGKAKSLLTFDHRVLDGVPATQLLSRVHQVLSTAVKEELATIAGVDLDNDQLSTAKLPSPQKLIDQNNAGSRGSQKRNVA
ncbi:MAG: hypothetical protein AAF623_18770 [Planctomycetota bacterium]